MNVISPLNPLSDSEAAALAGRDLLLELAERIADTAVRPETDAVRPRRRRRRLALSFATACALAVVAVIVGTLGAANTGVGPVATGPGVAQALSFAREDGEIVVIVRNPFADPARYAAEFAEHNLDVKLALVPASPSMVGQVVYMEGDLSPIGQASGCTSPGGGEACTIGVKVPEDYRGAATIVFGRAARPGERYETTGTADAPGEVLHGLDYAGRQVSVVRGELASRHVAIAQYRTTSGGVSSALGAGQVPGDWYVYDAAPWAPGQVLLFVGPTPKSPAEESAPGSPTATPLPASAE